MLLYARHASKLSSSMSVSFDLELILALIKAILSLVICMYIGQIYFTLLYALALLCVSAPFFLPFGSTWQMTHGQIARNPVYK
jgi:hypothetical protein